MKIKKILNRRGQATTEVVLLFPLFLIFIIFLLKIFGLLVLVQKVEIASAYAAKRWQMESHVTPEFANGWDVSFLQGDIKEKVSGYIGFNNPAVSNFLSLSTLDVTFDRTQYWNEVTVTVNTNPPRLGILCDAYDKQTICTNRGILNDKCVKGYEYVCESGHPIRAKKFVPNRDRPLPFVLPLGDK